MNTTHQKFYEFLLIKGYTNSSAATSVRVVNYFTEWLATQGVYELTEVSYSDALTFIQYCNSKGTGKKTQVMYIRHLNHYYNFLRSEEGLKENPVAHIRIKGVKRKILHDILTTEELDNIYKNYPAEVTIQPGKIMPPQERTNLARKRNKVILGLLIYQGLHSGEIASLKVTDVKLREGKIYIPSKKRSNSRTLKLEAHQLFDIIDYINDTRKKQLEKAGMQSEQLFFNPREAKKFFGMTQSMLNVIKQYCSKVKNLEQIRASVITHWVKIYDLRKAQYLAGHRYVGTTEGYKQNSIDDLKGDIKKYHPF